MEKFYKLQPGYGAVKKKDVENGVTLFIREDLANGIVKPYEHNCVGKFRIGLSDKPVTPTTLHRWLYCSQLCKAIM